MRAAFSALELLIAIIILGLVAGFGFPASTHSLQHAAFVVLSYIRYTQHLALNDSVDFATLHQTKTLTTIHPSIDPQKLLESNKNFWQIQFHQTGIYTLNSFSIFFDTPRFSPTTDRDNQPMPGDIIATNGKNKRCLSGYSNVNIAIECRNNSEILVRLHEAFGIESIKLKNAINCQEMGTFRIGFDSFGRPFCSKNKQSLTQPMEIILQKANQTKSICVLPESGYAFISPYGGC